MHTTWANDPVNSPNHYTRSHPGMECIELTADTSFCLGNAIKYLWRYHSKGRPVEDLEKARWYLCHVIALSCDGAIRKWMRRVAMMCDRHSACELLDRQEARG
ncbi:MAG: DUF3310 domain-containing protein [Bifidobacterium longum]|nr:DUF3310 domain-containing protein [Bifidobacterium longum]